MSDHEFINRGDRVRITIEGVHDGTLPNVTGTYGADRDFEVESEHADTITVELVERAKVPVKPGDVVKDDAGELYLLGPDGYTQVEDGRYWPYDDAVDLKYFTTDFYVPVSPAEVPF